MSARNTRRGLFDDQSASSLTPKERAKIKQEYMKQEKMKKMKPVPCDSDTDCMMKNPKIEGDGGY